MQMRKQIALNIVFFNIVLCFPALPGSLGCSLEASNYTFCPEVFGGERDEGYAVGIGGSVFRTCIKVSDPGIRQSFLHRVNRDFFSNAFSEEVPSSVVIEDPNASVDSEWSRRLRIWLSKEQRGISIQEEKTVIDGVDYYVLSRFMEIDGMSKIVEVVFHHSEEKGEMFRHIASCRGPVVDGIGENSTCFFSFPYKDIIVKFSRFDIGVADWGFDIHDIPELAVGAFKFISSSDISECADSLNLGEIIRIGGSDSR